MICISWFLKFRGERAGVILYPELSQAKMAANLWHQPSSHFCFWKKTKGGKKMAGVTRLELAASGVTGRRYNQLNYHPVFECHFGNYKELVGDDGLEPPTLSV